MFPTIDQWRFVYQIQLAHLPPNEDLWFVLLIVIEAQRLCVWRNITALRKCHPQASTLAWQIPTGIPASKLTVSNKQ
jgi:hypothetical protein